MQLIDTYDQHRQQEAIVSTDQSQSPAAAGVVPSGSRRSGAHTAAAVLNLLVALASIVLALPFLQDGAEKTAQAGDQPPFAVIVISFALGILGFVSTYGVWQQQRWGVVLTIVINALQFLSGVPGVIFGPSTFLVVGSVVGCVLNVLIIWLLLRRPRAAGAER